ncbi:MAG: hypothetical protein Q3979_05120 [Actinomycetaceae bacterium]|nr:hypothetical protein [Actinomycetaceae bacterium]
MTGNLALCTDGHVNDREGKLLHYGAEVHYPKSYGALKKATGLEAADD